MKTIDDVEAVFGKNKKEVCFGCEKEFDRIDLAQCRGCHKLYCENCVGDSRCLSCEDD